MGNFESTDRNRLVAILLLWVDYLHTDSWRTSSQQIEIDSQQYRCFGLTIWALIRSDFPNYLESTDRNRLAAILLLWVDYLHTDSWGTSSRQIGIDSQQSCCSGLTISTLTRTEISQLNRFINATSTKIRTNSHGV